MFDALEARYERLGYFVGGAWWPGHLLEAA